MPISDEIWMTFNQFTGGLMSGLTQVLIGQPFDTVKTRLQASNKFSSVMDCIQRTFKNEGMKVFFKGLSFPLVGTGFIVSVEMGTNQVIKTLLKKTLDSEKLSYANLFLSGCLAGLVGSLVITPVQHGKIRVQMQMKDNTKYSGSIDAVSQIYKKHGIKGVYKGFAVTCLRQLIPCGVYYLSYEIARRHFKKTKQTKFWEIFPCGLIAGTLFWLISYPIDIVKTKIQYDTISKPKYEGTQGIIKGFKQIKKQGWKKHKNGFYACMWRVIPVYGIGFYIFQKTIQQLTNVQKLSITHN